MTGKYSTGGPVDPSVHKDAVKLLAAHGVTDPKFIEWLGENLGRYRLYSVTHPGMKEQLKDIRRLAKLMAQVHDGLALDALPPECRAICDEVSWKFHGELFFDREQRLQHDLAKAAGLLEYSAKVMAEQAKRGRRKTHSLREKVLDAVITKLMEHCTLETAREKGAEVLLLCGVSSPDSDRAVRRATRTRKSKGPESTLTNPAGPE